MFNRREVLGYLGGLAGLPLISGVTEIIWGQEQQNVLPTNLDVVSSNGKIKASISNEHFLRGLYLTKINLSKNRGYYGGELTTDYEFQDWLSCVEYNKVKSILAYNFIDIVNDLIKEDYLSCCLNTEQEKYKWFGNFSYGISEIIPKPEELPYFAPTKNIKLKLASISSYLGV